MGKYNPVGFANEEAILGLGVHYSVAGALAAAVNMGTSKATKDQYATAIRHVARAEECLGVKMQLAWNLSSTLNYVGFLLENRNCSARSVGCYLSGIRRHWDVEQVEVEQGGKLSKWEVEQDGS